MFFRWGGKGQTFRNSEMSEPTSLPMHAVEFDRYVSHDNDDGMPSTTPAANTVVVAVPSLV